MESGEHHAKGMSLAQKWVIAVVTIAALVIVCIPWTKSGPPRIAYRAEALSNIRQLGVMLAEFEIEYGKFPDDETALEVKRRTKTDFILTGKYSNDYFRQMLAGGSGKSERPFWCNTPLSPQKADDNFSTAAKALEAGEVGFSYIMASPTRGQSSKDDPRRSVAVSPSYKFQTDWTFDPKFYAGQAVVLRVDSSASVMPVRKEDKKIVTESGKTLGDLGADTPWGTKMSPFLRAPLSRYDEAGR
jgi:hypothetical protein